MCKEVHFMYSFLAFLSGAVIAIMMQMNGRLSAQFGVYHAALYTHIVGTAFGFLALLLFRKGKSLLLP